MKNNLFKTLLASSLAAVLGLGGAPASAQSTYLDFAVMEGSVPGALSRAFAADKVAGNYTQIITFNGTTGAGGSGTFSLSMVWHAGQFVGGDGVVPVDSQLGGSEANQYAIYVLYQAAGTYVTDADNRATLTYAPNGNVSMYLDPNSNTTVAAPGTGSLPWTTGNAADDIPIAAGTVTAGQGMLDPTLTTCATGINCGMFGSSTTWNLTAFGLSYFSAPNPFYTAAFLSGQYNQFAPVGTQISNGSMDLVFGQAGPGTPPPPPAVIGFATFNPTLLMARTNKGSTFNFNSNLILGANAKVFDPSSDVVSLQIASATLTIPAGSFQPNTKGGFIYSGTLNGVKVNATIQPQGGNAYAVLIGGSGANLPVLSSPVTVQLVIGTNSGTRAIAANFVGIPPK